MTVRAHRESRELDRRRFMRAGFSAAGCAFLIDALISGQLSAAEKRKPGNGSRDDKAKQIIGDEILLKGLDGLSQSAIKGGNPFVDGHNAAAVIASAFFCQEQEIPVETQHELRSFMEARLLTNRIYKPQPKQDADAALLGGLLEDINENVSDLRRSGHNIIFATLSLKSLRAMPGTVTPARIDGLREMIRSFRSPPNSETTVSSRVTATRLSWRRR